MPFDKEPSPTTSIYRVLLALVVALLLTLPVDAHGIVHAARGMPYGPFRGMTLGAGDVGLQVDRAVHLDWPWDHLYTALGKHLQPSTPPLLAAVTVAASHSKLESPGTVAVRPRLPEVPRSTSRRSAPTIRKLRIPTPARPLRLLVTGDSLTGYLGPELVDEAAAIGPVRGFVDTHDGTGLTRPDYVDWSLVAGQQVAADHPDAVVVLLGGNDFQNMAMPGGRVLVAGTPAWTREYARRAAVCMRIWAQAGKARVYWLSVPPARDPGWAYDDTQIDVALRQAAGRVPGARYLDILGPVTNHGQYAD
ncbi:MAG: DUF459 domain-containing protein, partial [Chloroflexota bacterium]|nr:DUF459 domain-containing protein [Chloroflexota bacterium]